MKSVCRPVLLKIVAIIKPVIKNYLQILMTVNNLTIPVTYFGFEILSKKNPLAQRQVYSQKDKRN